MHPSSFERDISNFRIYISDLTHAQNVEVPEPQKFAYLKALLTHDTRMNLMLANIFDSLINVIKLISTKVVLDILI